MDGQYKELVIISKEFGNLNVNDFNGKGNTERGHIQYPWYTECYIYALKTIFMNNYKNSFKSNLLASPDNANNIIAFFGERGTGKTTAINEFGLILQKLHKEKEWWLSQLKLPDYIAEFVRHNFQFVVLDSIDASLLTEKEDIIEMILAKMYELFEEKMEEKKPYDNEDTKIMTEILHSFDRVYNSYHKLSRGENKVDLGDSVSLILKNVPTGPKIRKAFKKILDSFLSLMQDHDSPNLNQYLVITIDDLDLNIDKGYEILEQIHKYLSDLRIIVLIAVDNVQLARVCGLHFEKEYKEKVMEIKTGKKYGINNLLIDEIEDLANCYLLKAIPINNRIYMPDMKKIVDESYILKDGMEIEVKKYLMNKAVEKMGIYYDAVGSKVQRHFIVPDTVRQLVDYNEFLESLYTVDWGKYEEEIKERKDDEEKRKAAREFIYQYNHNHVRMNRDISYRMAYNLLSDLQYKEFRRLTEENILHRAKYAIDVIDNWLEQERDEWIDEEAEKMIDNKVYRYGDLLQSLDELRECGYEDQELVNCILAYFTLDMTKEYYNYTYSLDGEERKESKNRLNSLIGATFGNEWLGDAFPLLVRPETRDAVKIGFIGEEAQISNIELRYDKKGDHISNAKKDNVESKIIKLLEKNCIIELMDILLTFIYARNADGDNCVPDIIFNFTEMSRNEYICEIKFQAEKADFDILGFMGRINIAEYKTALADKILQGIKNGVNNIRNNGIPIVLEDSKNLNQYIVYALGIKEEMDCLLFPYYNLDLSYNVLKRVRDNNRSRISAVNKKELYSEMKRLYGSIAIELFKEDIEYGIEERGFYKKFIGSGFIQKFGITYSNIDKTKFGLKDIDGTQSEKLDGLLPNAIMSLELPGNKQNIQSLGHTKDNSTD